MRYHRTLAVIKRELKAQVMNKLFVIGTITIPFLLVVLGAIHVILPNMGKDEKFDITIVGEIKEINDQIKKALDQSEYVKEGQFNMTYELINPLEFDSYLDSKKDTLIGNNDKGIFYIPDSVIVDKKIFFYSSNPANHFVREKITGVVNEVLNLHYLREKNIKSLDLGFIQKNINIDAIKVTAKGTETESYGPMIIAFTLGIFLLFSALSLANPMVTTIVEEKVNRVYEILLSSLNPSEIMAGKIIGTAVTGLIQMTIWVACLISIIFIVQSFFPMPEKFSMNIEIGLYIYFIINYLLGLLIFLTLTAGLSTTLDNHQDAGQVIIINVLLIQGPVYSMLSIIGNPANIVVTVFSMLPFTSLYVMPARMSLIDVPAWQMFAALLVNFIILCALLKGAGKIYNIAILFTGKKPSLKEIIGWLKYA